MNLKHRSTTIKCGCGKCHTFYGEDAKNIAEMSHACLGPIFKNMEEANPLRMLKKRFTCCKSNSKLVSWPDYTLYENHPKKEE